MPIPMLSVQGNLTADPEYRTTQSGKTVANLRVAANDSRYDEQSGQWQQSDVLYMTVVAWNTLAEHVRDSGLVKGSPVLVTGRLRSRQWEDEEHQKHTSVELVASDIGPSLRRGTASYRKTPSQSDTPSGYQGGYQPASGQAQSDPWSTAQTFGASSEPEF